MKLFPIQTQRGARPHPLQIPWALAELAYSVYAAQYGRQQSLDRLAERGGFGPGEMDEFLPDWRERIAAVSSGQCVPGVWFCPVCDFVVVKNVMCAADGVVAADDREAVEQCPNGCATLRRQTWRQASEAGDKAIERLTGERNKVAELANKILIPGERFEGGDWREVPLWCREYIIELEDVVKLLRDDGGNVRDDAIDGA